VIRSGVFPYVSGCVLTSIAAALLPPRKVYTSQIGRNRMERIITEI